MIKTAKAPEPRVNWSQMLADAGAVKERSQFDETSTWTLYESGLLVISGEGTLNAPMVEVKFPDYHDGYHDEINPEWQDWAELVYIEDGFTSIGPKSFEDCRKLTDIRLPETLKTIEANAFAGCSALIEFILPEGFQSWAPYFLDYTSSLELMHIPSTLASWSPLSHCFGHYSYDLDVSLAPDGKRIAQIDDLIYMLDENGQPETLVMCPYTLEGEVVVPDGVRTVAENAFIHCRNLSVVKLPESVALLEEDSFWDTYLDELYVPNPQVTIERHIFTRDMTPSVTYGPYGSTMQAYLYQDSQKGAFQTL